MDIYTTLIDTCLDKGIQFKEEPLSKFAGHYCPQTRVITINSKLSTYHKQITLTHEIAHAIWDMCWIRRPTIKSIKSFRIPFKLYLLTNYKKEDWEEERFAHYLEDKPSLVLHLLKQL